MVKIVLIDAKDLSKRIDLGDTKKMLWKANRAIASMGSAAAAMISHMTAMGKTIKHMNHLMQSAEAFYRLEWISNASPEDIRKHLRHWSGSIYELENFYRNFNCFPCELPAKWGLESFDLGKSIILEFLSGLDVKKFDWFYPTKKQTRLAQGILLLIIFLALFLERF